MLGRKKVRRDRSKLYRENEKLKKKLKKSEARAEKYKKRYQVLNKNITNKSPLTPKSKVRNLLRHEKVSPLVKKKLLFSEVLSAELNSSFKDLSTSQKGRKLYYTVMKGKILKKYRLLSSGNRNVFSYKSLANCDQVGTTGIIKQNLIVKCAKRGRFISAQVKESVHNFLERDDNSRLCPGKNDCITKNKVKKQKRFLNHTLKSLHEKYLKEIDFKLSYSSFCSLKPFWVITPKVENRDTCACMLHTNTAILVAKLNEHDIFLHKKPSDVVRMLCCDRENLSCLHRKCKICKNRTIEYTILDPDLEVKVKKWITEVNFVEIKGAKKKVSKPIKKEFVTDIKSLVTEFETTFNKYLHHVGNIVHQYKVLKEQKDNINETSALIHIDFSENYSCKYSEEIQAVHFGGGRDQITLHTGVIYLKQETEIMDYSKAPLKQSLPPKVLTFCSLSKSLRHDALSVWAHLKPVLDWLFELNPSLENIHVQSDGVVTQYRNKTMFYFISNKLRHLFPKISVFTWNYSEAGHGKGAPDGIGGTLKRTADRIVAQGKDVENFESLIRVLEEQCTGIMIFKIKDEDIHFIENLSKGHESAKSFVGTLKVHQVVSNVDSSKLSFRSLSCFECKNKCAHFHMGEDFERHESSLSINEENQEEVRSEPGTSGLTCKKTCRKQKKGKAEVLRSEPGTSGLPCRKQKKEKKARLRYDEVYSSSDGDTPTNDTSVIEHGSYVIVRFKLKREDKKKRAANIRQFLGITQSVGVNNEIEVMFLKSFNKDNTIFYVDDNDVSFVSTKQIVATIEAPTIINRGCRLFYQFKRPVPVYQ